MRFLSKIPLFLLGGGSYCALELLWRGRTHYSMFLAGGAALILVGHLNHVRPRLIFPLRAVAGAGIITLVELTAGLLFNRDYTVWDYRAQPGNWLGQICPQYCVFWIGLAALVLLLYELLERAMRKAGKGL